MNVITDGGTPAPPVVPRRPHRLRLALLAAGLLVGLSVLAVQVLRSREPGRCFVHAIGFYTEPGRDPDTSPARWIEEYWRQPVDSVNVKESTDERGRPSRVVTWKSPDKSIKSTMSQHPDGSWQGGLTC